MTEQGQKKTIVQRRLRWALTLSAAFYLALVQLMSVAHAASGQAMGPTHDSSACVFCLSIGPTSAGLPVADVIIAEPVLQYLPRTEIIQLALTITRLALPPSRGPPSSDH